MSFQQHISTPVNRRRLLQGGAGLIGAAALGTGQRSVSASQAEGTVKFWHVWGGDREPILADVLSDFQTLNPGITVEPTLISAEGLQQKYLTAIAGGSPPDVMQLHSRDLPNFASRNALRNCDDLIARDQIDLATTFYPAEVQASSYNGSWFGLPLAVGSANHMTFWNKAHFREAGLDPEKGPSTWTELRDFSIACTKGSDGNFDRIGSFYAATQSNLERWFYTNNGKFYSDDGLTVTFNAAENIATLTWILESLEQNYGGFENIQSFLGGAVPGDASFFAGQISIHFQGMYFFLQLSQEAPDLEFGVEVPAYNSDNPDAKAAVAMDGCWNYVIPEGGENTDAAWELIKYTCSGQGQADFFKAQGRPSVVPAYNQDPTYQEANPYWPKLQEALDLGVTIPVTPVYAEDKAILIQAIEEALLKKRTPDDALNWATSEAQKIHDEKLGG
jgi:multiple sugar transport system substrate-binding protein